jgi:outer membrane protein assembly factor BamE (lipoprotein component of BamABCDE complex)
MKSKLITLLCLCSILVISGCSTATENSVMNNLHQLRIGMSTGEVTALIGPPATTANYSITAEGISQTWVYDDNQLMLNTGNKGAAMRHAFASGLSNNRQKLLGLDFNNGKLIKIGEYRP